MRLLSATICDSLRFVRFLFAVTVLLFSASSQRVLAHDPPEEYYDRRVTVVVEPSCVRVHYHVEMSQVSLYSLPDSDKKIDVSKVRNRTTLEEAVMVRLKE